MQDAQAIYRYYGNLLFLGEFSLLQNSSRGEVRPVDSLLATNDTVVTVRCSQSNNRKPSRGSARAVFKEEKLQATRSQFGAVVNSVSRVAKRFWPQLKMRLLLPLLLAVWVSAPFGGCSLTTSSCLQPPAKWCSSLDSAVQCGVSFYFYSKTCFAFGYILLQRTKRSTYGVFALGTTDPTGFYPKSKNSDRHETMTTCQLGARFLLAFYECKHPCFALWSLLNIYATQEF